MAETATISLLAVEHEHGTTAAPLPHAPTTAAATTSNETPPNNQTPSSSSNNNNQEQDEWLVSCRCESAKAFSTLLSCLRHAALGASATELAGLSSTQGANSHRRSNKASSLNTIQPVTVFCSPSNLTFHAHGAVASKQLQASVDMPCGLFSQYRVAQPEDGAPNDNNVPHDWQAGGEFCVNLHTLLECLHVLGTHNNQLEKTKLCFSYSLTHELFKMELLQPDTGVLMTAAIPGMVTPDHEAAGDSLAHAFRSSPNAARMIVKSDILRDVVQELECVSGATNATVVLGKNKSGLEMATCGSWGEVLVSIPAKGSHVVSWEPPKTMHPPIRTYSLKALLASLRGLDIAEETCITVNNNGMMAIQHQVINREVGDGSPCFVDFIMCCLELESDDEDDENQDKEQDESRAASQSQTQASYATTRDRSVAASQTTVASKSHRSSYSSHRNHNSDSDSDDAESHMISSSVAPLFSSVVADASHSSGSPDTRSTHTSRKYRRTGAAATAAAPPKKQFNLKKNKDRHAASFGSPNLLASSSSDCEDHDTSSEEEEESQPLDITAMASSTPRKHTSLDERDSECSSPELVYGRRH
jgi:hypothetical protein